MLHLTGVLYAICLGRISLLPSPAKMIYAYIRVSTDKQTVENQRFELQNFANERRLVIDKWVSEQVTGTKSEKERKLGPLLKKMKKGDTTLTQKWWSSLSWSWCLSWKKPVQQKHRNPCSCQEEAPAARQRRPRPSRPGRASCRAD